MGFLVQQTQLDQWFALQGKDFNIYAPQLFPEGGIFSNTDCIRYGIVQNISEIVFDQKSEYSFKEALIPVIQTLFFFAEHDCKEADPPQKGSILFLRSCDLHALKRLDDMYLYNGSEDYYYKRLRERVKIVLMGCSRSFASCFCVSMGTNRSDNYDMCINERNGSYEIDCKDAVWNQYFSELECEHRSVTPDQVQENAVTVKIPDKLSAAAASSSIWNEYDKRCVGCGRCNFVCPTCTCFTMQDMHYTENGNAGERRRVWASCMVDGFTDVAGGGSYRKKHGERMRFKVLHKVLEHKQRFGHHMCVGCGRCDDICPEYISFSNCINKLENAMKEVDGHDAK